MSQACQCRTIADDDPRYEELRAFMQKEENRQGVAMTALQEAQRLFGYLPLEVHKFISQETGVPVAELYGVTTFYSQFTTIPKGQHQIQVCMGTACYVKGAQKVLDKVVEELGVGVGMTTEDRVFTINAARCLGCCGLAPVMMIDDDVYANLDDVDEIPCILASYRRLKVSTK
ncbi:MAG: NAD(P)H-dependent oxidoreductase subunit E [Clostridiaceae bacterium]|nr:NAD(P)H-dependent oxidoreductase subunit E [Clostridiaceae bacterium]